MRFQEIIGQHEIKKRLTKAFNEGRLAHSLLFTGPNGVGKLALALAYAQFLSCENRNENDSCGECPACRKYQKLVHPDLHFVFPVVNSPKFDKAVSDNYIAEWRKMLLESPYTSLNTWLTKMGAENKQAHIGKSESGEILKKLNFKTVESDYKVMIIWLAEKMNLVAANKLLKILEEPPEKTVFLLISENQHSLLKTILSRTQIISVPRILDKDLKPELIERLSVSEANASELCRMADGSFFNARHEHQSSEDQEFNFEQFSSLMRMCYKRDVSGLTSWSEECGRLGREKIKNFLEYALKMIRQNFILNQNQKELARLNNNEMGFSEKFSPFIHDKNINEIYSELNRAHYHIERNGYIRLVLFDLSLKLVQLLRH